MRAHAIEARRYRSRSTASSTSPCGRPRRSRAHFVQRFPERRRQARRRDRSSRSLYDDEAIYVGVWADDPAPRADPRAAHAPRCRRARRRGDRRRSTRITIAAPPTCSSSTPPACSATCCCSTTRIKTTRGTRCGPATPQIGRHGWTAEFRIPLNQLRYADDNQEWGFQIVRMVGRTQRAERVVAVAALGAAGRVAVRRARRPRQAHASAPARAVAVRDRRARRRSRSKPAIR